MNYTQAKNNIYRSGQYHPDHSRKLQKDKATEPTGKQILYRNDLYKFCLEKGMVRDGFRLGRTNREISANINAFKTILHKNGMVDEFRERTRNGGVNDGNV